jgi:hypothetical protein
VTRISSIGAVFDALDRVVHLHRLDQHHLLARPHLLPRGDVDGDDRALHRGGVIVLGATTPTVPTAGGPSGRGTPPERCARRARLRYGADVDGYISLSDERAGRAVEVAGPRRHVTSPDKVFFPRRSTRGDTKLDLVEYYLSDRRSR